MPEFGKKIFFLNPHSVMQKELLEEVITREFEVYLIYDHVRVVYLMQEYPDSILFINIDNGLSRKGWQEYIEKLIKNPATSDVKIGVLSYDDDHEMAELYLKKLMLPCGFIRLKLGMRESAQIIIKTLEVNEARGRRKFVRSFPSASYSASFDLKLGGDMFHGMIRDISSVGMAFQFDHDPHFSPGLHLNNLSLRLKNEICHVRGVIYAKRPVENSADLYVVLFEKDTDPETRQRIRFFVHQSLQFEIDEKMKTLN